MLFKKGISKTKGTEGLSIKIWKIWTKLKDGQRIYLFVDILKTIQKLNFLKSRDKEKHGRMMKCLTFQKDIPNLNLYASHNIASNDQKLRGM